MTWIENVWRYNQNISSLQRPNGLKMSIEKGAFMIVQQVKIFFVFIFVLGFYDNFASFVMAVSGKNRHKDNVPLQVIGCQRLEKVVTVNSVSLHVFMPIFRKVIICDQVWTIINKADNDVSKRCDIKFFFFPLFRLIVVVAVKDIQLKFQIQSNLMLH